MKTRTLVALSPLMLTSASFAAITGVTGQATLLGTPPVACTFGSLNGFNAFAWDERTNIATTVKVDETQNPGGNIGAIGGAVTGTFNSHFIHYEGTPGVINAIGTVTFDAPIFAVIFVGFNLDNSDPVFGSLGTTYPTGYPFRQLGNSIFTFTGNTLTFNLNTFVSTPNVAQLRVLTQVPAPAGGALLGLAGLAGLRRRRN
jgi:MYXO-CTERM domain-containing protein